MREEAHRWLVRRSTSVASSTTWHGTAIPPVLRVGSGDEVTFDADDASNGQITAASTVAALATIDFANVDQVCGPVYVEGAEPGDTLQVELLDFQPGDWGWTAAIPGFGLLADSFPEPALRISRVGGGVAELFPECASGRAVLRLRGRGAGRRPRSTIPPTELGGNMDTRHLTAGATLWLPVAVPGALFSHRGWARGAGRRRGLRHGGRDAHARPRAPDRAQGRARPAPEFRTAGPLGVSTNTAGWYAADGVGPDLLTAAREAAPG